MEQNIDLLQYICQQGYKRNTKKSSSRQVVLEGIGDEKLLVLNHRSSNTMIYKNLHDDRDKGNIVNFVINRLDGYINTAPKTNVEYAKAAAVLSEYLNLPQEKRKVINTPTLNPKKQLPFVYELYKPTGASDTSYLEGRGITPETINNLLFKGRIINCQAYDFNNEKNYGDIKVGFPTFKRGKIVGLDMHSSSEKRFAPGSKKAESFWSCNYAAKQTNVVYAESPIDLLSYHQLKGTENNFYLSSNGTLTDQQVTMLMEMMDKKVFKTITSAMDNDFTGHKYDLKIISALSGAKTIEFVSSRKDELDLKVTLQGLHPEDITIKGEKELLDLNKRLIQSYQLEKIFTIDKSPLKDWNNMINPQ